MKRTVICLIILFSVNFISAEKAADLNKSGAAFGEQGKYDEAMKQFTDAEKKYRENTARAYHNKAYILELQGKGDEAAANYETAMKLNPEQIDTVERVGFWSFKKGDFDRAVELGESVLKKDPANMEVRQWLPEAYKQKMLKPKVEAKPEKAVEAGDPKSLVEQAAAEEKKAKIPIAMLALDIGLRFGYNVTKEQDYPKYIDSPGKIINIPYNAHGWYRPGKNFDLIFRLSNPYLGGTMPNTVSQEEFVEAGFKLGSLRLAGGFIMSHYYDDFNFNKILNLTDIKFGGSLTIPSKEGETTLTFYPRLVPMDNALFTIYDESLDTSFLELKHSYVASGSLSYYSRVSSNGYYFFDHKNEISNYYGFTEIGLGLTLDNQSSLDKNTVSLSIEYCKRLIFIDLNNDEPFGYLNGQGFLGFNSGEAGFTGYYGSSDVLRINAKESISDSIFVYQKFMMEFVDRHFVTNEFILHAGAGVLL